SGSPGEGRLSHSHSPSNPCHRHSLGADFCRRRRQTVLRLCSGKEKTRTIEKARSRVEERTVTVFNQLSRVVHLSRLEICPNGPSHVCPSSESCVPPAKSNDPMLPVRPPSTVIELPPS